MNETTPDPADVHTGPDRVELTDGERAQRLLTGIRERDDDAAALRFINGWMQALTAERDRLRVDTNINADEVERQRGLLDLARAELTAANARCAELEAMDAEWQRRVATLNSHGERADLIAERNRANREREEARSEAQRQEARKTELQATLDRVTALADEWEAAEIGVPSPDTALSGNECAADLRAALTPEGTE